MRSGREVLIGRDRFSHVVITQAACKLPSNELRSVLRRPLCLWQVVDTVEDADEGESDRSSLLVKTNILGKKYFSPTVTYWGKIFSSRCQCSSASGPPRPSTMTPAARAGASTVGAVSVMPSRVVAILSLLAYASALAYCTSASLRFSRSLFSSFARSPALCSSRSIYIYMCVCVYIYASFSNYLCVYTHLHMHVCIYL